MTNHSVKAFSIGIIFSTAILSFVYYFATDHKEAVVTKDDIQNYIKSENLVVLSKQEYDELKLRSENNDNTPEEQSVEPTKESEKKQTENEINNYTLTIRSGMNSMEIATLLEEEKIIANASEFDTFLREQNLNTTIQIGSFDLTSDMSYELIADIITK